MPDIDLEISNAVEWYWETLSNQADNQKDSEKTARGRRAQVLGGAQMDGFAGLIEDALVDAGLPRDDVLHDHDATLPGFFRATKRWDIAVVHKGDLLAVIELKSIASSFGNNLNNRIEEALGNNVDLADTEKTRSSVTVREPNFEVEDEFKGASYLDRAELLCSRLVRKGIVDSCSFITSSEEDGLDGEFSTPNPEFSFEHFLTELVGHVEAHLQTEQTGIDDEQFSN